MKVKVRKSGTIFIGVTIFLGIAAANTGNNLLYILVSAMLSLMLTSGIISIINIRRIAVSLIPPPEVYARRPVPFRVLVKRTTRFPSFLIRVASPSEEKVLPIVTERGSELSINYYFQKRGAVDRVKVTLSSDFPLGTFERILTLDIYLNLVVFPEPVPAGDILLLEEKGKGERMSLRTFERGYDEIRDLKTYGGEPLKLIHWKTTAKRGELMVKLMGAENRAPVILDLEKFRGTVEEKISKMTFLVNELMKRGVAVGLKLGEREIPPRWGDEHRLLLLRELALY
jgi:uncharacterized protein (DUF58 family)